MPTLSSILVQRGAASMRAVEDAIGRQVLHGGDLPTNLLELGAVAEPMLTAILAESLGLEPAPSGRLYSPPAAVIRLIPTDLALRHGIFPLALRDRLLVLAVSEPLPQAVTDDLGFALDLTIKQVAAPLVRVREALVEHYGVELERRYQRLLVKLDGPRAPRRSAPPPEPELPPVRPPKTISVPAPSFGTGLSNAPYALGLQDPEAGRLGEDPAAKAPYSEKMPRAPGLPIALDELTPAATPPSSELGPAGQAAPTVREPAAALKPPGGTRALVGWVRHELKNERTAALLDKSKNELRGAFRAPRRKGPFTTAMAEEELESAPTTDAVLDVLFSFACQFFEYSVLFVIHGDLAEGRDAVGSGAGREKIAGIGVPLDLPSTLALARERRAPVIGPFAVEGLDADLRRDLGRDPEARRAVALLPVVVRNRVVALLYGDDGEGDVSLPALGDVIVFAGLVAKALERILLRKKLGARAGGSRR